MNLKFNMLVFDYAQNDFEIQYANSLGQAN